MRQKETPSTRLGDDGRDAAEIGRFLPVFRHVGVRVTVNPSERFTAPGRAVSRPEFGARKRLLRLGLFGVLDPSRRRTFEAVAAREHALLRGRNQRELP